MVIGTLPIASFTLIPLSQKIIADVTGLEDPVLCLMIISLDLSSTDSMLQFSSSEVGDGSEVESSLSPGPSGNVIVTEVNGTAGPGLVIITCKSKTLSCFAAPEPPGVETRIGLALAIKRYSSRAVAAFGAFGVVMLTLLYLRDFNLE